MNAVFKNHLQSTATPQAPNLADWQLQDAKNRFSQVVRAAREGVPQWVTVHGKRAAVVLSAEAYEDWLNVRETSAAANAPESKMSLVEALRMDLPENGLTDEEIDSYFGRDRTSDAHRWVDL